MFSQIGLLLADLVSVLVVFPLLARFHFQWLRVSFRNPVGEFIIAVTDWAVGPARRVLPALGGLDTASIACAWLVQALSVSATLWLRGADFDHEAAGMVLGIGALAAIDLARYSLYLLMFALIVQAVLSWVNPYSPVAPLFDAMTRRFLRPLRRFVPAVGGIDLTPLALIVLLQVLLIPLAHLRMLAASLV